MSAELKNPDFWPVWRQFSLSSAVMLAIISTSAAVGYHTVLLQQLPDDPGMDKPDLNVMTWIVSVGGISTFPAYILGPILMQKKGRKPAFITSTLIVGLGWLVAYFSRNSKLLILANSILSFGTGILETVGLLTISEFMEPKYRSIFSISSGYIYSVTIALTHFFGWYAHWRNLCLISLTFSTLGLLIGLYWVETPVWLASKGKFDEAEVNYKYLRGNNEASMKEYQDMIKREHENRLNKERKFKECSLDPNTAKNEKKFLSLKVLFTKIKEKPFYRSIIVVTLIYILFLASGSLLLGYYLPLMCKEIIQNDNWTFYAQILYNSTNILGGLINIILTNKIKNKTFLLISVVLTLLLNALISCYLLIVRMEFISVEPVFLVVLLTSQGFFGSLGLKGVAFGLHAELIPISCRSLCTCVSYLLRGTLGTILIKSTPYLFLYLGFDVTFGVFTLVMIVSILVLYPIMPETSGMTLEEIEQFYKR